MTTLNRFDSVLRYFPESSRRNRVAESLTQSTSAREPLAVSSLQRNRAPRSSSANIMARVPVQSRREHGLNTKPRAPLQLGAVRKTKPAREAFRLKMSGDEQRTNLNRRKTALNQRTGKSFPPFYFDRVDISPSRQTFDVGKRWQHGRKFRQCIESDRLPIVPRVLRVLDSRFVLQSQSSNRFRYLARRTTKNLQTLNRRRCGCSILREVFPQFRFVLTSLNTFNCWLWWFKWHSERRASIPRSGSLQSARLPFRGVHQLRETAFPARLVAGESGSEFREHHNRMIPPQMDSPRSIARNNHRARNRYPDSTIDGRGMNFRNTYTPAI
jgi:hypothetical protein